MGVEPRNSGFGGPSLMLRVPLANLGWGLAESCCAIRPTVGSLSIVRDTMVSRDRYADLKGSDRVSFSLSSVSVAVYGQEASWWLG